MSAPISIKVSGIGCPFLFDDTPFVRQEIASRVWTVFYDGSFMGMSQAGGGPVFVFFDKLLFGEYRESHYLRFLNDNCHDYRAENVQLVPRLHHKLGEVREDGMVFWEYSRKLPKGEHWITPERFQELFPRVKPDGSAFKRGDFNSLGAMCLSVQKGKPTWVSLHSWDLQQAERSERRKEWKARPPEKKFRAGQVREDGMVFVSFSPDLKGGEYWVSPEKYAEIKQAQNEYKQKNAEKRRQYGFEKYYRDHEASKKKHRERYYQDHEASKKKSREYNKKRREEDVIFAIITRVRSRLRVALKGIGKKSKRTHAILGISHEGFAAHIESQFLPGMSWENRDQWHLDHIVPLALAETEWDVYLLNHYTNLRPLWGADNLAKSASVPDEIPDSIHAPNRDFWEAKKKLHFPLANTQPVN